MKEEHDKLATRLSQILMMLNEGKRFSVRELVEEFNVDVRTIQRDLQRFSYLPIKREGRYYSLEPYCLGKLSFKDIRRFAAFSSIKELYPELNDGLIVDILNERTNKTMEVHGHKYESLSHKIDDFNAIASAIITFRKITFGYKDKVRFVEPYKLNNTNGIWYLVAVEEGVLKNFSFSKIEELELKDETFCQDEAVLQTLQEHKGVWFSQNSIEVVVEVDASVASYFLRRDLLPHQQTVKQTKEVLVLSAQVAYEEEILKVVRYWIPHMRIVTPSGLQKKLEDSLKAYLNVQY